MLTLKKENYSNSNTSTTISRIKLLISRSDLSVEPLVNNLFEDYCVFIRFLMKYMSLFCLTLQNVTSILLLRYVRTRTGPRFINSTAVVNSEIQKTIFSILLLFIEEGRFRRGFHLIYHKFVKEPKDTLKTGIPALLYVLQNNLLYIAISNLDAATFQVRFPLVKNDLFFVFLKSARSHI